MHWLAKVVLLGCLTFTSASYTLLIQYTKRMEGGYINSTVVVLSESLKLSASSLVLLSRNGYDVRKFARSLYEGCARKPRHTLRILMICAIYSVQNNLTFIAISNLDSSTFQVTSQIKIISVAFMSYLLLDRRLAYSHWLAVVLLFVGVTLVQIEYEENSRQLPPSSTSSSLSSSPSPPPPPSSSSPSYFIGLLTTLTISFTSGFAGVSFEKLVKRSDADFWMCNFQMHSCGFLTSACILYSYDYDRVARYGAFVGFSPPVVLISLCGAVGGLLVSLVIGFVSAVAKSFSVAGAVITSVVFSHYAFDIYIGAKFMCGSVLVCLATCIYNTKDRTNSK